jgi:inorganic pyrophosphatase
MVNYKSLPIGNQVPSVIYAVVEIPKDSKHKYEYDPPLGVFRLDRVLQRYTTRSSMGSSRAYRVTMAILSM